MTDEERPKNPLAVEGDSVFFKFGKHAVLVGLDLSVERGIM